MYSENLLKSVILTSALVTTFVSAAPAEVACDKISTYTTEFFEDRKNMIWVPEASTCLFYTEGNTANAARIAQSSGMATVWDLFRCDLYADRSRVERLDPSDKTGKKTLPADPSYPLRCVFAPVKENGVIVIDSRTKKPKQSDDEHTFFENMSRAMARQCDIFASLMTTEDRAKIPMDGIWGKVEFEELQLENNPGKVDDIDWFDSSLKFQGNFWCREGSTCDKAGIALRSVANATALSLRDNSGHVHCADPTVLEANDYTYW